MIFHEKRQLVDDSHEISHARIQKFLPGGGGQSQSDKKSSDNVFFFFKSSAYFTLVKWSISKKSIIFSRFQRGPTFSRGSNFFQGGGGASNCLFPIETHINCDFPGAVRTPCPHLWIRTCIIPYFFRKLEKMSQNLSSAAVVIGALRVNILPTSVFCC